MTGISIGNRELAITIICINIAILVHAFSVHHEYKSCSEDYARLHRSHTSTIFELLLIDVILPIVVALISLFV